MSHFWQLILGTVVALLPVINPVASAPVLLSITEGDSEVNMKPKRQGALPLKPSENTQKQVWTLFQLVH